MALANRGDNYVKHLIKDALETTALHKRPEGAGVSRRPGTASISIVSNSAH
jgi:hypothetical protein